MTKQEKINFIIGTGLPSRWKVKVEDLYQTFDEFYESDDYYREQLTYIADNHELYPNYKTLVGVKNACVDFKKKAMQYEKNNNVDYFMRLIESTLYDRLGFTIEEIKDMVCNNKKTCLNLN